MDYATLAVRIRAAPFHQWLALELESADAGGVVVGIHWRDELVSRAEPPTMHGGIVAALIDVAGLYAVLAAGGAVRSTAYLHVDYHRSVPPGPVKVRSKVIRLGRSLSVADAMLYGDRPDPLASGRGGYVP